MHQTGHIAAVLHLDRHNEAAVSLGDNILLQVLGALARDHAVERFAHLAGHAAQLTADAQQLGRRTVRDLLLGDDGGRDGFLQVAVAGEQTENRRERGLGFVLGIVQQGTARGLQQACHRQQLARIERAAAVRAGQDRAYLSDAAKGRTALTNHQVLRVRGLLQPQLGLLVVVQRAKRAAFLLCRLGCRLSGQFFQYFVVFQCFKGFFA